jgi:hypothetical protein
MPTNNWRGRCATVAIRKAPSRSSGAALASYGGYLPNGEHPMAATASYELGQLLVRAQATRAEGLRLLGAALAMREKFLGADDPATREVRAALNAAQGSSKT